MTLRGSFKGILGIVADVAGEEAARRLAAAKGGGRCYIPRQTRPGHWLVALLGEEAAAAVCDALGGETVEIPLAGAGSLQHGLRQARRRAHELNRRGWSADRIARTVGVDRRTVKRWRQRWREVEHQPDLFHWQSKRRRG